MGTKMTLAYANIFMVRLEGQLLRSATLRPFLWLRFTDDIDMKWSHGRDEANNNPPSINKRPARVSVHKIKACGRYNICLSPYKTNRYIPVSLTHKLPSETLQKFLTALHFASNITVPIWTLLNQEQQN